MVLLFLICSCAKSNSTSDGGIIDSTDGDGGIIDTGPVGTAPNPPSGMSLTSSGCCPSLNSTPTVTVSGVSSGNLVKIFTDSNCSQANQIGESTSIGSTVDILVASPLSVGSHMFYANASNDYGTSPCSGTISVSLSYDLASCPENFIPVPNNPNVGTYLDFCVMKYEAREVAIQDGQGATMAASIETGSPYRNVSGDLAFSKCNELNTINGESNKYHLISNAEWMTIARNAESVQSNWESNILPRGWAANTTYGSLWTNSIPATSSTSSEKYNIGIDSGDDEGDHLYKRTLTLTNGEEIWDLSGNIQEWVDWDKNIAGINSGISCNGTNYTEFTEVVCTNFGSDYYKPLNGLLGSVNGVGKVYGGGNFVLRGGHFGDGNNAGVFSLMLYFNKNYSDHTTGFRCAYSP